MTKERPPGESGSRQAPRSPDRRRFLGHAGAAAGATGVAWVAPNVITVPAAAAATLPLGRVAAVGGSLLAGAQAWTSTTLGITWTAPTSIGGTEAFGVATDGAGLWAAVGTGDTWTSPDGAVWTASSPSPPSGYDGRGVATDGSGNWVSVGISSFPVYRTTNPATSWIAATTQPATGSLTGVATDGIGATPTWVAVGPGGAWRSNDSGDTWTQMDTTSLTAPLPWNGASVATDGLGNWVTVGPSGGWTWSIADTLNRWVAATTPPTSWAAAVATDATGRWVAVGNDGTVTPGAAGRSWISTTNGVSWVASTLPPTDAVNGVASNGAGAWATVGNGASAGGSWCSADGDTWTQSAVQLASGTASGVSFDRLLP